MKVIALIPIILIMGCGSLLSQEISSLGSITRTPTNTVVLATDTPDPLSTPTETATPTPAPTETATPAPDQNLLLNPDFSQTGINGGFDFWTRQNNIWVAAKKPSQPLPNQTAAKLGHDSGTHPDWDVGDEDWLWQDVLVIQPHTEITFTITEIQHMVSGIAEIRIYGCLTIVANCEGSGWQEIWFRPAPDAPPAQSQSDFYTFTYTIPANYPQYRLEFYGKLLDEGDAWKYTLLGLEAE